MQAALPHIDDFLQYVQILWIETPHFRIGINLPAYTVPMDPVIRAKIRDELTRLAEKLPRVNPKARRLDPWLRAHLVAHRLEKLYAETQSLFGVKDEDFPAGFRVARIDAAGHFLHQEKPDAVNRILLDWLRSPTTT